MGGGGIYLVWSLIYSIVRKGHKEKTGQVNYDFLVGLDLEPQKHTHIIFDLHTLSIAPLTLQPLRLAFCRCCYDRYAQVSVKVTRQLRRTYLPVMPKALFRLSPTLDRSKFEQFYFCQFLVLPSSQVFT